MKTFRCTFEFEVPGNVSGGDVNSWINFELHKICSLIESNPLAETELEATDIISVREV